MVLETFEPELEFVGPGGGNGREGGDWVVGGEVGGAAVGAEPDVAGETF